MTDTEYYRQYRLLEEQISDLEKKKRELAEQYERELDDEPLDPPASGQ